MSVNLPGDILVNNLGGFWHVLFGAVFGMWGIVTNMVDVWSMATNVHFASWLLDACAAV
jgi:hypothetical protein